MESESVMALIMGLLFTIAASVFVGVFVMSVKKAKQFKKDAAQASDRPVKKVAATGAKDKHALHVADALAHQHKGQEEHYEEIVGSLGDVHDEGCADLNGVRFIAHDLAYEPDSDGHRDMTAVAKAMVMGEVLNNPRFNHPYHRK